MSDMMRLFDSLIDFDEAQQKQRARLEHIAELRRRLQPRCGNCDKWMKSSECPREKNVNGYSRGPSMSEWPCPQYVAAREIAETKAELEEALKP